MTPLAFIILALTAFCLASTIYIIRSFNNGIATVQFLEGVYLTLKEAEYDYDDELKVLVMVDVPVIATYLEVLTRSTSTLMVITLITFSMMLFVMVPEMLNTGLWIFYKWSVSISVGYVLLLVAHVHQCNRGVHATHKAYNTMTKSLT